MGLDRLEPFLGSWEMTLSRASFLPDPEQIVRGRATFERVEGSDLVAMRLFPTEGPAAATWIIGRDDSRAGCTALYSDARGVSRVYEMSVEADTWKVWRDDADFSQRFEAHIADDRIEGTWERRFAGGEWEHDFDVAYSRAP
jgi:hypothetical protein